MGDKGSHTFLFFTYRKRNMLTSRRILVLVVFVSSSIFWNLSIILLVNCIYSSCLKRVLWVLNSPDILVTLYLPKISDSLYFLFFLKLPHLACDLFMIVSVFIGRITSRLTQMFSIASKTKLSSFQCHIAVQNYFLCYWISPYIQICSDDPGSFV